MCGFVGIVNFNGVEIDNLPLEKMTNSIMHRGPDDFGYYNSNEVRLGFRRLSIIDITNGHQPMNSKDNKFTIVFNGEIYNFKEIKEELLKLNYKFETKCDTEVIIYAYQEWGNDCIVRFNGMFAFAIHDKVKNCVFMARDRLGIKPFYYTLMGNTLIFGSEIKSILQITEFERIPDFKSISSYLTFRYTYGDRTFFENIKKLLPGHTMTIDIDGNRTAKYWSVPNNKSKKDFGEKYYIENVRCLLSKAVERRLVSDVTLGALLSGGLDSSIIVALMSKISKEKVNSYSIGFDEEGYDETKFAEIVASHCSTNHSSLMLSQEDYLKDLNKMIIQKDAPLSIPHEIALFKICEVLKQHTTVVISGEGADELFAGYGRVQRSPHDFKKINFVNRYIPKKLKKVVLRFLGAGSSIDNWLKIKSVKDYFFSVYNWMPFEEKHNIFTDSMMAKINADKELINYWEDDFTFTKNDNDYDQILYLFEKNHLSCLLDRLDGMSMAAGVEARVPFVDHELVEFVSQIPIKYKLKWKNNISKYRSLFSNSFKFSEKLDISKFLLRKIGLELLPKIIPYRKKKGFPVPLDSWAKNGLLEYAKEILLDERAIKRNIFKIKELKSLLDNNQNLDYDFWGKKIWMLINIEIWHREFID